MSVDVLDLELTIVKADGLAAKDTNIFGMKTKSDPYVIVHLCPQGLNNTNDTKILVGKTVPKMKTLAPRWDQAFTISLPKADFNDVAMFELTIMDYDNGGDGDDLMGRVQVNIPVSRPGTTTKWYGIPATSADGEEATGRIQCTLTHYSGVKTVQELAAAASNRATLTNEGVAKPEKQGAGGDFVELKLVVKKADGLVAMDSNFIGMSTSSDPYIEVRLCPFGPGGEDKKIWLGKTATQMSTLSPKYNETFKHVLPKKQISDKATFELTIMDYDETNEDDLMGVVPIPVKIMQMGSTTKWYDVPKCSSEGGNATGKVHCTLTKTAVKGNADDAEYTADRLKAVMSRRSGAPAPAPPASAKPTIVGSLTVGAVSTLAAGKVGSAVGTVGSAMGTVGSRMGNLVGSATGKPGLAQRQSSAPAAVVAAAREESEAEEEEREKRQSAPAAALMRASSRRLDNQRTARSMGSSSKSPNGMRAATGSRRSSKSPTRASHRSGGRGERIKRTNSSDGNRMRRSVTTDGAPPRIKRTGTGEGHRIRRAATSENPGRASSSGRPRVSSSSSSGRVKSSRQLVDGEDGAIRKSSHRGSKEGRKASRSPVAGEDGVKRSSSGRLSGARGSRSSRDGGDEERVKRSSSSRKISRSRSMDKGSGSGDEGIPKRSTSSRKVSSSSGGRQDSSRKKEGRPRSRDDAGEGRPRRSKSDANKAPPIGCH